MRISWLLAVPALVVAEQVPLQAQAAGWFDKAKSFIPGAVNPLHAAASFIASQYVEQLTTSNWQQKLTQKPEGEEEWLIYVTGGNKTCFGRCTITDKAWTEAAALMAAQPRAAGAPALRLGVVNCESDQALCTAWASGVPAVFHFDMAKKSIPQAKSPLHCIPLNSTTTTIDKITSIPSSGTARYRDYPEYEGLLHPVDGALRQYGLIMPFGYTLWGFGSTPGWLMMIIISFFSRQMMTKKALARSNSMPAGGPAADGPATPAQARARPAPPAAAAAAPRSGGKKKR